MKTPLMSVLLVFSILLSPISSAAAATNAGSDARYFVKSTSSVWKNSFGARNNFSNGFSADLSDWQLRVAKIFGLEVEHVQKLSVLPVQGIAATVETPSQSSPSGSKPSATRPIPSSQVPWGVAVTDGISTTAGATGGKDVTVAVLDTGILKTHPDLVRRVADCKDFSGAKPGIVNGKCDDKNGHGTHVAGIIAADGGKDGRGIYGVAPEANIFAYKVCDDRGSCWADDIAVAIRTAFDNGAHVINLSLGSDVESTLISDAISYADSKDVLVVTAAGNDGPYQGSIDYPGANPNAVAVAALDINKDIPDWSSRGINTTTILGTMEAKDMEFAAPGVNIESTWKDGNYAILSGTSMAAPHITGLAAKLWNTTAPHPAADLRDVLHQLATDVADLGEDDASGLGLPHLTQ